MLPYKRKVLSIKVRRRKLYAKDNILKKFYFPNHNFFIHRFLIPSSWHFYVVFNRDLNLYLVKLFSSSYYFNVPIGNLGNLEFHIDRHIRVIYFINYKLSMYKSQWFKDLSQVLFLFTSFFFIKIKFRGKGYYLYKNKRNTIAPQFGYYHRIYIYSFFNHVKFLTKTKILIFGFVKNDVLSNAHNLKGKRPINIFTGKGVRFAKQVIYKKTGKVSAYR